MKLNKMYGILKIPKYHIKIFIIFLCQHMSILLSSKASEKASEEHVCFFKIRIIHLSPDLSQSVAKLRS